MQARQDEAFPKRSWASAFGSARGRWLWLAAANQTKLYFYLEVASYRQIELEESVQFLI